MVSSPFAYPAVIKLRHGREQRSFDSLRKAEDFVGSLSQNRTFAADPQGSGKAAAALSSTRREGLGGRDGGDAGCPEEDGGGRDMVISYITTIVVGHLCLCCFYFLQKIFMLLFTLPCF